MTRFQYCLNVVLGHEGGVSNHKSDRGGLTNKGVTQKTYDDFCKLTGRTQRPVTEMTDDELEAIYSHYWKDAKCSYLPEPLDLLAFDSAVNHGPSRAIKFLQRALGTDEDGIFGRQTIDALHEEIVAMGVSAVCDLYLDAREDFYDTIIANDPSQAVFAKGWVNRIDHLRGLA